MIEKRKYTKNTCDLEKIVVEMYNSGVKKIKIAENMGMSCPTVNKILKKNNLFDSNSSIIVEEKILKMYTEGCSIKNIIEETGKSRSHIYSVFKKNRLPKIYESKSKEDRLINELISMRLFYYCNDIETLAKRLAIEVTYQKPKKIIIPKRFTEIIKKEKINKVVNILEKINIECKLEYKSV